MQLIRKAWSIYGASQFPHGVVFDTVGKIEIIHYEYANQQTPSRFAFIMLFEL